MKPNSLHLILGVATKRNFRPSTRLLSAPNFPHTDVRDEKAPHPHITLHRLSVDSMATTRFAIDAMPPALEKHMAELESTNIPIRLNLKLLGHIPSAVYGSRIASRKFFMPRALRPITFLTLPAEIRNKIYEFSGCLEIRRMRNSEPFFGDNFEEESSKDWVGEEAPGICIMFVSL